MNFSKQVTIEVNGKFIQATVSVDAPGLDVASDCVNAQMILTAVANNQNCTYRGRHLEIGVATILVNKPLSVRPKHTLKLVA